MEHLKALEKFDDLLTIMDRLRKECPWDKEQTLDSLRFLTIEETYELSDAIIKQDLEEVRKELGDLMLHIVFYSKIGEEKQAFDISQVIDGINKKLIMRHPHIFGDVKVNTAKDVLGNWEEIKLKEKGRKTVLEGVPKGLPPMVKAFRVQQKAAGIGFDWDKTEEVLDKVKEEYAELQVEIEKGDKVKTEEEFGDLLFALVNYARFIDVEPDEALEKANQKFIKRFNYLEQQTLAKGQSLRDMTLSEMNVIWDEAKKNC
jgi:XTP/dITP diphosphohydrolase